MRIQKSIKNLIYSLGYYAINVLSSFVLRKIMLVTIGLAGVSLNSLFHEVISMMSLTEMGVGTAIVYNLYKPLSDHNEQKIKELMSFFKRIYLLIAALIFGIGCILLPFIQNIVNSTGYEVDYIRYIFMLFVIQTAVSYCFSYKRSLLAADQRNYVAATIDSVFKFITIAVSCIALWLTKRFDVYLITVTILSFINNLCVSKKVDGIYPFLRKNKEKLSKSEVKQVFDNVKNLFVSKIAGTITNSTDNILISILVNTLEVGRYANYALIINAFKQILVQITNAFQGSVGNLYTESDSDHIDEVLRRMTYGYFCFATVFCCGYFGSATSFVSAVFGEEYKLSVAIVFTTTINMFFHAVRDPFWQMMTVSGLFREDRNIAVVGTLVNLIVSIVVGKYYGIVGIFFGTTCTYVIQIVLKIPVLYQKGLNRDWKDYFMFWGKLIIVFSVTCGIVGMICRQISFKNTLMVFFAQGFISVVISMLCVFIFTFRMKEFVYFYRLLKEKIRTAWRDKI